jgi:hypothetical protein
MVSIHDEELLQLYLDRELALTASREIEVRVTREPMLAARLESLVSAREARTRAFESFEMPAQASAAALDQLLLSLRAARASELIAASRGPVLHREETPENPIELKPATTARQSFWTRQRQVRFWGAAAACLFVGLLVGIAVDRRPATTGGPIGTLDTASLAGFGLANPNGNSVGRVPNPDDVAATNVDNSPNAQGGLSNGVNPLVSLDVAVRVVRADGKTFVFRFPDEDSADAWMRAMYDRLARENLESKFDFEVIPTWY